MNRRELLFLLSALAGLSPKALAQVLENPSKLYDLPPYGEATLLYFSDLHGQAFPHHFMEPPNLIAPKPLMGRPGYLTGEAILRYYGVPRGSLLAHLLSYLDFVELARAFGPLGGFSALTALIRTQKAQVEAEGGKALVLDGGDTWTNSGLSLLTQGEAIVEWQNLVGVDHMVSHWEWTLGRARVEELLRRFGGELLSYNVVDELFGDPLFPAYRLHRVGPYALAVVGASYPYVKVSHPEEFTEGLSFALDVRRLQEAVDRARAEGADAVVLLSHNGLQLDAALAERVQGIDLILSGHTHDLTPLPWRVGKTWIVAGSTAGKALMRVDLKLKRGGVANLRVRVLPVLANHLPKAEDVEAFLEEKTAPHRDHLFAPLAVTETLLYKRDTLYSTWDQLVGEAVRATYPEVEVVFSPAVRWGTTLLPGQAITYDHLYAYLGFTYPELYLFYLRGEQIRNVLEDIASNVFTPDPFYQQGGDVSRAVGLRYVLDPDAPAGRRIREVEVGGRPLDPNRRYLVAAYGGRLQRVGEAKPGYEPRPIHEVVAAYLKSVGRVRVLPEANVRVLGRNYRVPEVTG
ncbi:5'-nucleotidase/2',3'-cyclic phosphodiesterase-like hydrolase [Thermus oshimai JL-2]|uniref:5'-nucleotidase/2',3'-cyclic phosphodiesterase-like hydrolase n=1 Tax=Thermus oshimai JL-2 TaxID=751945 RepID=K7R6V1_THEOS|nr:thiosulfohydrolase SoxB [Thermus oshimai]AFV76649.1 5'-nucleotidase/2',3'-cyclic phosphodiesterase-like hydrolase [Thermus oshimai JL-2]